jgi:hypothetical protein
MTEPTTYVYAYADGPGLMPMQVRAVAEAVVQRLRDGGTRRAEIMTPLVGTVGDPDSIHFFHRAGLDHVSCSPSRIAAARLDAGRAALIETTGTSETR